MKYIQGQNRNQVALFPVTIDESINPGNEVRIIDLFVESLSVKDFGFRTDHNTISNFRRNNGKAIRKVFAVTVQIAKHFGAPGVIMAEFAGGSIATGLVSGHGIRVESNIHYPTNNSLLWNCIKEAYRLMRHLKEEVDGLNYLDYSRLA